MAGMRKPTWRIYNDTNPNFDDIYYDNMWLTYIFKNPGAYKISIEVEDTNGNKNIAERNMVIVK
jgi:PKD repeat protein